MRFATEMLKNPGKYYQDHAQVQDIMETLAGAGISAGGQLLFTDMDPTEIGISSGLGIGASIAARPVGARVGYGAGRALDKHFPNASENSVINYLSKGIPGTPKNLEYWENLSDNPLRNLNLGLGKAKHNQNYVKPDGTERGFLEGTLGLTGRLYGDTLAQAGVALAMPSVMSAFREPEVGEPTAQLPI